MLKNLGTAEDEKYPKEKEQENSAKTGDDINEILAYIVNIYSTFRRNWGLPTPPSIFYISH